MTINDGEAVLNGYLDIGLYDTMEETDMTLLPDLFSFAYVPSWYCQLDELAELARPEPWRFREPIFSTKNQDTPILERYIHAIFKKQAIDFNEEKNPEKAAQYFYVENEYACFHTGLYTARYKAIWGVINLLEGYGNDNPGANAHVR